MHNELTKIDLEKMQQELDYRRITLRPQLLEEVKVARSFGDLSENFEYKAAKREKNRNESRIRFLENMIKTARVYEDKSDENSIGLYDRVTLWLPEDEEEEIWQIVTTVRQDPLNGRISKESPAGRALLGKKVGDTVYIQVDKDFGYEVIVRAIEKGEDDGSAELNQF
jgi:transcription elongation factor GreA